jgi:leucyl/phenylalanyl-tRNA--protein transferase
VEAWDGSSLVGGLYGLAIGRVFCGESMFARAPDASKVAFVRLVQQLDAWGFPLVDCQVYTEHLARFGAVEIPRRAFLARLAELRDGGRPGPWAFDDQK